MTISTICHCNSLSIIYIYVPPVYPLGVPCYYGLDFCLLATCHCVLLKKLNIVFPSGQTLFPIFHFFPYCFDYINSFYVLSKWSTQFPVICTNSSLIFASLNQSLIYFYFYFTGKFPGGF